MSTNYDINYEDKRFQQVESEKKEALSDLEQTYAGMIQDSDKYYQAQIDASKEWADKQSQLQQEKTDFAIDQIEQQKQQAKKDYTKEQSGAYVDWQKQSNQYGANAEKTAAGGMTNTGFAESSQVSMYNTYQNRVATARESYNLAVINYNNSIKEARLQNNSVLAEIAYEALQQQLALSLEGFQYKNQLLLDKANKKTEMERDYYGRYQDVLAQINQENALAEEIRQYNESMAFDRERFEEDKRQFDKLHSGSGGGGGGGSTRKKKAALSKLSSKQSASINKSSGSVEKAKDDSKTMSSIINLGYGPVSASQLDKLVSMGKVEEYTANGVTMFRNTGSKGKNKLPNGFNATLK